MEYYDSRFYNDRIHKCILKNFSSYYIIFSKAANFAFFRAAVFLW
jgi:hypothetical protein